MKRLPIQYVILLLVLFILTVTGTFLSGCGTPPTTTSGTPIATVQVGNTVLIADPAQNAKFVNEVNIAKGLLQTGGTLLLNTAAGDKKLEYAQLLSGSGHVFEALETGSIPSDAALSNALSAYFPSSSGNAINIANLAVAALPTVKAAIAAALPTNIQQSNPAVYAAYVNYSLNALAQTAYATADPFLTGN